MSDSSTGPDELRAKDLIRPEHRAERPPRRVVGEGLVARMEQRKFTAPGSDRRARLFDKLGLANPWDTRDTPREIQLGPVALKMDGRRTPAPHASVPDRKKKAAEAQAKRPEFNPRGVPRAKPTPPPRPKAKPPPPPPSADGTPPADGAEVADAPPPRLGLPPKANKGKRPGRVRMRRTVAHGPKERKVPVAKTPDQAAVEAAPPPSPPERHLPGSGGLDDLFGFSGGADEGRMRLGRRSKKDDDSAE